MKVTGYIPIIIILCFSSCVLNGHDDSHDEPVVFSFSPTNNEIAKKSEAIITDDWIDVYIETGTDMHNLVADFNFTGYPTVSVDGAAQETGITANDFSNPVTYKLESGTGEEKELIITVKPSDSLELDAKIVSLMKTHHAPSFSLAIVRNEKLVFVKSYGVANVDTNDRVTNESLYRVASVSKAITALAILKLLEEDKLEYSDTVFGQNGVLGFEYGTPPYDENIEKITIGHLLDHYSGWTSDQLYISSYKEPIDDLIDHQALTYEPGTFEYYLNLNYCILGRVIEKLSGESYKDFVKTNILIPCGITDMDIGINPSIGILPNEVRYFDQDNTNPHPNNWDMTFNDSFSGWVATPSDLMKIMVRIDRMEEKADIFESSALDKMMFGNYSWYYSGEISGTACYIKKINPTVQYFIVTNTRTKTLVYDMSIVMESYIKNRQTWPEDDLF